MSGFKTVDSARSPASEGLFSPQEIERLMRVEFERAQRYHYPILCLKIGIDRLGTLQDLYGLESKEEILQSVISLLKSVTRESDFIAYLLDDRLLSVLPHTPPVNAPILAKRLLDGARNMVFQSGGRSLRVTLSIGISHNQHPGSLSFETLLKVADEGLAVADAAGGDRFIETELYQLYENQRRREAEPEQMLRDSQQIVAGPQRGAPPPAPHEPESKDPEKQALSDKLYDLIASQGTQLDHLNDEERGRVLQVLALLQPPPPEGTTQGEHKNHIDILERRIHKLTEQLGVTEEELRRIARMKGLDLGIHSIYRTVQGLSDDEDRADLKREMMSKIFEANFKLKESIAPNGL